MPEIIDYKVVRASDLGDLSKYVNKGLAKEWQPFGSLCATITSGNNIWYSQAMVKYKQQDTNILKD